MLGSVLQRIGKLVKRITGVSTPFFGVSWSREGSEQSGRGVKGTSEPDDQLVLTVGECAKILRVDKLTVLDLLESGKLHGFSVGEEWRVSHQKLVVFLHTRSEEKRLEVLAHQLSDPKEWGKELLRQPDFKEEIEKGDYPEGSFGRFLKDGLALLDIDNNETHKE